MGNQGQDQSGRGQSSTQQPSKQQGGGQRSDQQHGGGVGSSRQQEQQGGQRSSSPRTTGEIARGDQDAGTVGSTSAQDRDRRGSESDGSRKS